MPNWRDEYLQNIHDAQSKITVDRDLIAAYSQLIDRVTALEAEKAAQQDSSPSQRPPTSASKQPAPPPSTPSPQPPADPTDPKAASRLRADLAEALRQRGQLQTRLRTAEDELARLRARTAADSSQLRDLAAERKTLARKLRDRDDELREKMKLVADVQDELAVLNMELTVAERERRRAQDETKALVDRWMRRVGREAEAMNEANEPGLARR